jgi:hypothetical protein
MPGLKWRKPPRPHLIDNSSLRAPYGLFLSAGGLPDLDGLRERFKPKTRDHLRAIIMSRIPATAIPAP